MRGGSCLNLTRSGRALLQKAPPVAQERLLAVFDRLPDDERKRFADTFEAIVDSVGGDDGPAPMLFEDDPLGARSTNSRRYQKRMRQRSDLSVEGSATAEGIPVAPDMTEPRVPIERAFIDKRVVLLCLWSVVLALATGFIAQALVGAHRPRHEHRVLRPLLHRASSRRPAITSAGSCSSFP